MESPFHGQRSSIAMAEVFKGASSERPHPQRSQKSLGSQSYPKRPKPTIPWTLSSHLEVSTMEDPEKKLSIMFQAGFPLYLVA